jgi:hypothetical protein
VTSTPIQTWLARLKRRFSPSLVRLTADGTQPLGGGNAGTLALVGRELCLFLPLDAGKVAERQRKAFVGLAVRRAAPFPDPEFDVLWTQGHAAVWYWSRQRVAALPGLPSGKIRFRAEALYRGVIHGETGCELLAYEGDTTATPDQGFEGRAWRQGHLVATRYWRTLPPPAVWQTFVRGAGLAPDDSVPEPASTPLRPTSLTQDRIGPASALTGQLAGQWRPIAAAVGTLVLAALLWQAAGVARVAWETRAVQRRVDLITERLSNIVGAREHADAAQARIDAALALRPPVSQTRLLGEVAALTPGTWELLSWNLSNPETLEVTLKMASPDPAAVVAAWEASPLLADVTPANRGRQGELTLQARVVPLQERAQ